MNSIIEQVKKYREVNNLSYSELAKKIGVSPDAISEWERGKAFPTQRSLTIVENWLNTLTPITTTNTLVVTPPEPVVVKRKVNRVALVLDNSGSMRSIRDAAQKAHQQVLNDLIVNEETHNQTTFVDVIYFGSTITNMSSGLPPNRIRLNAYNPNESSTRLLDGIGAAIEGLRDRYITVDKDDDVSYLVIAVTDGLENASRKYFAKDGSFNRLVKEVQDTDRWTITVQVPRGSKASFCKEFAIPSGNVVEWDTTDSGVVESSANLSSALGNFYTGRSVGATSARTFYTNTTGMKATDLSHLTDVARHVKIWEVKHPCEIREFCETNLGHTMRLGAAFYQLTKTEDKVGQGKMIMIRDKRTQAVYVGTEARKVLRLPSDREIRIVPGNHGDYEVFIQSSSTNRKLVPGTKVIYFP